jgi:hypothetical protein
MTTCNLCNSKFTRKYNLDRHMNSVHGGGSGSKTNKKCKKYYCKHCDKDRKKGFTRKDAKDDHERRCGKLKQRFISKKNINKKNKDIDIDEDHVNPSPTKGGASGDENINIIILNYPPNINSFMSDVGEIVVSNNNLIIEIIKKTNINKNRPEHHNIYYPDLKNSIGQIYEDDKWKSKSIYEIIDMMIDNNIDRLETFLENFSLILSKNIINNIKNTCQEFRKPESRKNLVKQIKLLLFNHRDIIRDTKNKTTKKATIKHIPSSSESE